MTEWDLLVALIKSYKNFAIYGAQVVGYGVYLAFKSMFNMIPTCFLVSSLDKNPHLIDKIPVYLFKEYVKKVNTIDTLIIVAVTEVYQKEICENARLNEVNNLLCVTGHIEYLIMSRFLEQSNGYKILNIVQNDNITNNLTDKFQVFLVKNVCDRNLIEEFHLYSWEHTIQSGTTLANKKIADYADNIGLNISLKNPLYSELTATYWVWKNIRCEWKGIAHYRRRLLLTQSQIGMLLNGFADAVLPLPYICYPNAMTQLKRFISKGTIELFLSAIYDVFGSKADYYSQLLSEKYQYAYNLLYASTNVFDEYCGFLFEILEKIESYKLPIEYRSLAYIGEVLTTMFFISNSSKLKICHTEREILCCYN